MLRLIGGVPSLKRVLKLLNFIQSQLDPCTFKLYVRGELQGLVVVEIDDLLCMGSPEFFKVFDELRGKFTLGKFVYLDELKEGASFNGRRLRVDGSGGFLIDKKCVEERLHPVELQRGHKAQAKEEATKEERGAAVGALTWGAKEGLPDGAAQA